MGREISTHTCDHGRWWRYRKVKGARGEQGADAWHCGEKEEEEGAQHARRHKA